MLGHRCLSASGVRASALRGEPRSWSGASGEVDRRRGAAVLRAVGGPGC